MMNGDLARPRSFRLRWVFGAAVLLAGAGAAAQTDPAPAPAPAPPAEAQPEPRDARPLRRFIEERLAETQRQEERLRRALELLDAGEPHERVMELLGPRAERPFGGPDTQRGPRPWGERRGGEAGPPGPDEPPGEHGDGHADGHADGRGEGRGGGRDGREGWALTPEQRERVVEFLTRHMARMPARFREAWAADREAPGRLAQRIGPRVMEVLMAERRDARLGELKREEFWSAAAMFDAMARAGEAYANRQADPGAFDAALAALRQNLGEQFDIRARIHERETELLAQRLEEARAEAAEMSARREQVVEDQLQRFVSGLEKRRDGPWRGRGHDGGPPPGEGGPDHRRDAPPPRPPGPPG